MPEDGRAHFDEAETFTHNSPQGTNLLWTATHEFGHVLGLDHSTHRDSIMFPYYPDFYHPNLSLEPDDIAGIQSIYSKKSSAVSPGLKTVIGCVHISTQRVRCSGTEHGQKCERCLNVNNYPSGR